MSKSRRMLIALPIGAAVAAFGLLCSMSGSGILTVLGLAISWHLAVVLSLLFPSVDWELTKTGVLVFALMLPALEWALIAFGLLSLRAWMVSWRAPACV